MKRKGPMTLHMQREMEKLKKMILALSAVAEESVQKAVQSLERWISALAEKVIARMTRSTRWKSTWRRSA